MVPWPVTTPSPGTCCSAMPNSVQRCSTNMSVSSNEFGIEQELDALAGGELAALVLRLDPPLAAAQPGRRALGIELIEDLLHRAVSAPMKCDGRVAWPLLHRKPTRRAAYGARLPRLASLDPATQGRGRHRCEIRGCPRPSIARARAGRATRCATCSAISRRPGADRLALLRAGRGQLRPARLRADRRLGRWRTSGRGARAGHGIDPVALAVLACTVKWQRHVVLGRAPAPASRR